MLEKYISSKETVVYKEKLKKKTQCCKDTNKYYLYLT